MKKIVVLTLGFIMLVSVSSFAQCAMCQASVTSNLSEGRGGVIGTGLNFGILYLLLTPYFLIGALIFMWFRTGKKELRERLAIESRLKEIFRK